MQAIAIMKTCSSFMIILLEWDVRGIWTRQRHVWIHQDNSRESVQEGNRALQFTDDGQTDRTSRLPPFICGHVPSGGHQCQECINQERKGMYAENVYKKRKRTESYMRIYSTKKFICHRTYHHSFITIFSVWVPLVFKLDKGLIKMIFLSSSPKCLAAHTVFVSPAKHSDTKGSLCPSSVFLSVCHTFLSHFPKLCFAGDTCIPRNAATIFIMIASIYI